MPSEWKPFIPVLESDGIVLRYEPVNTLEKTGFTEIVTHLWAHISEHVLTGATQLVGAEEIAKYFRSRTELKAFWKKTSNTGNIINHV